MRAAGVGFADVMARQGVYPLAPKLPCIMGYEASGVVEAHGYGVTEPAIGTRVMAVCHFGAQAEFVNVRAEHARTIPDEMSFEQAACLPWNYTLAYHLIFRAASVRTGDRVLVHMAAGGVGTAAVHVLRTIPNVVLFGTASGSKLDVLRAEGCEHAIDYRSLDYAKEVKRLTHGQGVDVVVDPLGGKDCRKGYELLRPGGRLVAYGFANMMTRERRNTVTRFREYLRTPRFSPISLLFSNRSVAGVGVGRFWDNPQLLTEGLTAVLELHHKHRFSPRIDSVHSFGEAAAAHRRIEDRVNVGKVLLAPRHRLPLSKVLPISSTRNRFRGLLWALSLPRLDPGSCMTAARSLRHRRTA